MTYQNLHLIKGESQNILYACESSRMISLANEGANIIEMLKKGYSMDCIQRKYGYDAFTIRNFVNNLKTGLQGKKASLYDAKSLKNVSRITLHVSNDCNLRCKYCFAEGGDYNSKRTLMNKDTAHKFVEFCAQNFDKVKQVMFFGGEPFLNLEIMKFICSEFDEFYQLGKIKFIPNYGIITNGTIINEDLLNFIEKYISVVTVSIDGDKEINDENRIYKNGKGSYDKISNFIQKVKKITTVNLKYEATFTQEHIDKGHKHSDVSKFLWNNFGINGVIVNEKSLPLDYMLKYWDDFSYKDIKRGDFQSLPNDFWDILDAVTEQRAQMICPVVIEIFSVSVNGNIYPCHMLTGERKHSLGNIKSENIFNATHLYERFNVNISCKENYECKFCWAKNLCGGCTIQRFYDDKEKVFRDKPNYEFCQITKLHLEKILLLIAQIRKDPETWQNLLKYKTQKK